MSLDSFADIFNGLVDMFNPSKRSGGRRPEYNNQTAAEGESHEDWKQPVNPSVARLTIVQVTDVYTLENFPSLKTFLKQIRKQQNSTESVNPVVSMLTGDFLAPYLLSSVDHGAGMMHALHNTPIDILTWGNHDADIPHKTVCRYVRNFPGIWINSNMQDHDEMEHQVPYHIIIVQSEDGSQTRKIGLVATLSNDPKLYSQFGGPGAFGGATLTDPWECLAHYKDLLTKPPHNCDLVVPLEHMYMHENQKTCEHFDIPLILSGHDHHRVDEKIHGTRLVKAGMDAVGAAVVEIEFPTADAHEPRIRNTFVEMADYEPDQKLKKDTDAAYDVLLPLRNTQLMEVLPKFRPLTSKDARSKVTTMGKLICSLLKTSLNQMTNKDRQIDTVILMGGNIRGNADYDDDSFFSMETLEAEVKSDEVVGVVKMPGHVLAAGIAFTHAGDPKPGWMQYDDGIEEISDKDGKPTVTRVNGKSIDPDRMYRVATKIKDLTNGQSEPLKEYFVEHSEELPAKGGYYNIHSELMAFFARSIFRRLWDYTGQLVDRPIEELNEQKVSDSKLEAVEGRLRLAALDHNGDGVICVDDIHWALKEHLGLSVVDEVKGLAKAIHTCADVTGSGTITYEDFEAFCTQMPPEYRLSRKWSDAFPEPDVKNSV